MLTKAKVLEVLALLRDEADLADVPRFDQALAEVAFLEDGDPRLVFYHPTWDVEDPDDPAKWRALWLPPEEMPAAAAAAAPAYPPEEP